MDYGPSLQESIGTNDIFPFSRNARKVHPAVDYEVSSPLKTSPPRKEEIVGANQQSPISLTYGWDPKKAKPASLPMFFPRDLVKLELPRTEFVQVLDRIQNFLRRHSIQAMFENVPVSASLQTVDLVEFRIKFWEAHDKENFYVDIQRQRGEHLKFRCVMRQLLDAIKGLDMDDEPTIVPIVDKVKEMHAMLQRLTPVSASVEVNPLEAIIHHVHSSLTSRCFSNRTAGLECLVHFTDMRQSMISATRQGALLFLRGQAPTAIVAEEQDGLDRKCHEIQQVLFQVLQRGGFEDELITTRKQKRRRGGDEESGTASLHKAITILVNSLETLSCNPHWNCERVVEEFFARFEESTEKNLYLTLIDCIEQCHQHMAIGYLACKAMRLLVAMSPHKKDELRADCNAKGAIERAWHAGQSCHSLLEAESKMLLDIFST